MKTKGIVPEDFVNYKVPSMFINSCYCDFKCCTEAGISSLDVTACQNSALAKYPISQIDDNRIYRLYKDDPITKAVVIGGLEPMLQIDEILDLLQCFRGHWCADPFVIYTGYYPDEIRKEMRALASYKNVIIKFGRYIPNIDSIFDPVLGVTLASKNQYAERIS